MTAPWPADDGVPPLPDELATFAIRLARDVPAAPQALRRRVLGSVVDALGESPSTDVFMAIPTERKEPWAEGVAGLAAIVLGLLVIPFVGSAGPPSASRGAPIGQTVRLIADNLDALPSPTAPSEATARTLPRPRSPKRETFLPRRLDDWLQRDL